MAKSKLKVVCILGHFYPILDTKLCNEVGEIPLLPILV
jgi:hypothetical protein